MTIKFERKKNNFRGKNGNGVHEITKNIYVHVQYTPNYT